MFYNLSVNFETESLMIVSLPEYIPKQLRSILEIDAHGISFPCKSGCQMRFIRDKVDMGGFYSYKQWGGIDKALKAAMNRNRQLKMLYPTHRIKRQHKPKPGTSCGFNGVGYREKLDKRRNEIERFYWVSYRRNGKPAVKTFSLGYSDFSPDLQLHAYRTAIQFRAEWDVVGNSMDEDKYKKWKTMRLYDPSLPKCDYSRKRRKKANNQQRAKTELSQEKA